MERVTIPGTLDEVLDDAWQAAKDVPGFLSEEEARFLGMVAATAPSRGSIVEIGSFKGKSTVMLARVTQKYNLGRVAAIDPHNFNDPYFEEYRKGATTFDDFSRNVEAAGVADVVDVRRAFSEEVAKDWKDPIRFLWIDGDHSYPGAKLDFDGFFPHLSPGGIVAFHDALHEYPGPIRVFLESVLRSTQFGPAGFVGSIAWAQFRPEDGALFGHQRAGLERLASRVVRCFRDDSELAGIPKILFKLNRFRVPRSSMKPQKWAAILNGPESK